jgi:uncharacterized protein (DUF58 family)
MMEEDNHILDPQFLRRLERMSIVNKRMIRGTQVGKRRSRHLGSSIEFADYRSYTPGDDLRQLDWNAYARLGKLFLKTFLDEQEWHISLYIDCSKSMGYGEPSKFNRAIQLAAALGFLSLNHFDRISAYGFDQQVMTKLPALLGKGKTQQLFHFLQSLRLGEEGNLNQAFTSGQAVHGRPGISIVFSDFLFEDGYEKGLSFVQAANQEVTLVHMLAKEERAPQIQGDLRLVDSETQEGREIALTPHLLEAYTTSLRNYQDRLASFAFGRGMTYIDVEPEQTIEQIIFQVFQQSGLVR